MILTIKGIKDQKQKGSIVKMKIRTILSINTIHRMKINIQIKFSDREVSTLKYYPKTTFD